MSKWKIQWYKPRTVHSHSVGCVMSPRDAADLEWPLSEGMQVSALLPVCIAMIISCWNVKLLKLPSVTLTHVCDTHSHNWWAKGLPGVGAVKIFCDSDSLGWKSFRLRLLDSDSTALPLWNDVSKSIGKPLHKFYIGKSLLMNPYSRVEKIEKWEIILPTVPELSERKSDIRWDWVMVVDRKDI